MRSRKQGWTLIAAIAALVTVVGCASMRGGGSDDDIKPLTIEVKNNLTMPTQITVYVQSQDGFRQLLGDIPPADSRAFAFTPRSYAETYRLIAQIPLARPFRSQPFTVGSEMTGWIQWTLIPNIIGFWDREEDTAVVMDSTQKDSVAKAHPDSTGKKP